MVLRPDADEKISPFEPPRWETSTPELSLRPRAVAALAANHRFRSAFFRVYTDLFSLAKQLHGHHLAQEALTLLWRERRQELQRAWAERLEVGEFAQCVSALRNVFHNALERATGKPYRLKGPYDVRRRDA